MSRDDGPDQSLVLLIDGALSPSESVATLDVINPSNGRGLFSIPSGCESDVNRAVAAARRAFDNRDWSEASPLYRKRVLHRLADLINAEAAALDVLDAQEMGKPVGIAFGSATVAGHLMRFYAECVDKVAGDVYVTDGGSLVAQRRVPRGVVGAVTPWNFPTLNAVRKLAPALAAGNSVVLKPSELCTRSALRVAQLALEAGLPSGVLNVVPGAGEIVGRLLALHPDVDMVTFTGSTEVGKKMLQYAGQSNLKLVMAECGGKCPHVVFDDGLDLDLVCESVARLLLTNQGQICSAGSRVLVQQSIAAALIDKLIVRFGEVVIGDAVDQRTTFGPLVSAKQCAMVMRYVEEALDEGAQLIVGGRRVLRESGGYFVEPTILTSVAPTARVAQEEIFGPVLSVITFRDEQEAVHMANGTIYALAAYVWTSDLSRGMRVAKRIHSSVWINAAEMTREGAGHATSVEPTRQSGIGAEGGLVGMESYLRRQLVWINHA